MAQPIPKHITKHHDLPEDKPTYTLLIDGNSLLETSWHGDPRINSRGQHIGGVFQFLLQIKILLSKRDFDFVYVIWDGDNSGQKRFDILPDYKSNRDKTFITENVHSDYYDKMDSFMKRTLEYSRKNKEKNQIKLTQKEDFHRQKNIIQEYLEELFVRQVKCDLIEGDDNIAYYCLNKKPNDRVYIVTGDLDISQMLDEYVCVYVPRMKKFITINNFKENFGYSHKNILLVKIICGDTSDAIKGVKGVEEKGLLKIMPEIKEREVTLEEVIQRCKELAEKRTEAKLKPLIAHQNIINGVTDGIQNGNLYSVNEKVINLKKPLMSKEAIELMDDIMYSPIDGDGRTMANLYKLILRDDITELIDQNRFSNFFSTFNKLIDKEKKFYEKWLTEN